MLNVRNGGYWGYFPVEPTPPQHAQRAISALRSDSRRYTVNFPYYGRFDRTRNVTAATLTRYADKFAGKAHEFKFGFEFERSKIRNESGYPGGRYYYDYGGAPYHGPVGRIRDQCRHEADIVVRAGFVDGHRSADDQSRASVST